MNFLSKFGQQFDGNKTFKPTKKIERGTRRYSLVEQVSEKMKKEQDHTNAVLFEVVQCPADTDLEEWYTVHVIDFYNKLNVVYSMLEGTCTSKSCKEMSAGPKFSYLWKDSKDYKKATAIPASQYIAFTLDWMEQQLNDTQVFPSNGDFPKDFKKVVSKICTRMLRIYAHIFFSHFEELGENEKQITLWFKHFFLFCYHFDLIPSEEIEVMQAWAQAHLSIDVMKPKRKVKTISRVKQGYDISTITVEVNSVENYVLDVNENLLFSVECDNQLMWTEKSSEKSKSLQWNETFTFAVPNLDKVPVIRVTLNDRNYYTGKKTELGSCELKTGVLIDEKPHEEKVDVKSKQDPNKTIGQLKLQMKFTSSETGSMKYITEITSLKLYEPLSSYLKALKVSDWVALFDNMQLDIDPKLYQPILTLSFKYGVPLMETLITSEVQMCSDKATILRVNSLCTRLIVKFMKSVGSEYLQELLGPFVEEIATKDAYLEIDPQRAKEGTDYKENMSSLLKLTESIVDSILHSTSYVHPHFREVLMHLEKEMNQRFQDEKATMLALSGLVLLRFITPALTLPTLYLNCPVLSENSQRTCQLLGKLLTNIGNNAETVKESYMKGSLEFVKEQFIKINKFLKRIGKEEDEVKKIEVSDKQHLWSLYSVHSHFYNNLEKFPATFMKKFNYYPIQSMEHFLSMFSDFMEIIQKLGPPNQLSFQIRQKISQANAHHSIKLKKGKLPPELMPSQQQPLLLQPQQQSASSGHSSVFFHSNDSN